MWYQISWCTYALFCTDILSNNDGCEFIAHIRNKSYYRVFKLNYSLDTVPQVDLINIPTGISFCNNLVVMNTYQLYNHVPDYITQMFNTASPSRIFLVCKEDHSEDFNVMDKPEILKNFTMSIFVDNSVRNKIKFIRKEISHTESYMKLKSNSNHYSSYIAEKNLNIYIVS